MLLQPQLQRLVDAIERAPLQDPPSDLQRFAKAASLTRQRDRERRRHRRYSLIANVVAVPLDEELRVAGEPFVALSSGMSVGGLRLLYINPSPSDYLFVQLQHQPVRFLLSVLRTGFLGDCFEIAGELMNLGSSAPCNRISSGVSEMQPATLDDLVHWAGLRAATRVLSAENRLRNVDNAPVLGASSGQ